MIVDTSSLKEKLVTSDEGDFGSPYISPHTPPHLSPHISPHLSPHISPNLSPRYKTENASQPSSKIKVEAGHCEGCRLRIKDKLLLEVNKSYWHPSCLKCCVCQTLLEHHPSCYVRDNEVYCKIDYMRNFSARCAKCCRSIGAADWVRRARDRVYHLACFACDACKRQMSTGDEFALHDSRVLCKLHYLEIIETGTYSNDESDINGKLKTKRVRTTFSDEQLHVLQANFQIDSNPDGQDLERIAQVTGLSKRVTQVWFQNNRARQKKYVTQGKRIPSVHITSGYTSMDGSHKMNEYTESSSSSISSSDSPLSQIMYSFG